MDNYIKQAWDPINMPPAMRIAAVNYKLYRIVNYMLHCVDNPAVEADFKENIALLRELDETPDRCDEYEQKFLLAKMGLQDEGGYWNGDTM